jgi:hypothetical protein
MFRKVFSEIFALDLPTASALFCRVTGWTCPIARGNAMLFRIKVRRIQETEIIVQADNAGEADGTYLGTILADRLPELVSGCAWSDPTFTSTYSAEVVTEGEPVTAVDVRAWRLSRAPSPPAKVWRLRSMSDNPYTND